MQTKIQFAVLLLALLSPHAIAASDSPPQAFELTDEMLGSREPPMSLVEIATTPTYGYTPEHPIKLGCGFSTGRKTTYSYLNALLGLGGEQVHYKRLGSCCEFETPNSPFGDKALLEVYEISYEGIDEAKHLYFNWYDAAAPQIPVGLTARAQNQSDQQ